MTAASFSCDRTSALSPSKELLKEGCRKNLSGDYKKNGRTKKKKKLQKKEESGRAVETGIGKAEESRSKKTGEEKKGKIKKKEKG